MHRTRTLAWSHNVRAVVYYYYRYKQLIVPGLILYSSRQVKLIFWVSSCKGVVVDGDYKIRFIFRLGRRKQLRIAMGWKLTRSFIPVASCTTGHFPICHSLTMHTLATHVHSTPSARPAEHYQAARRLTNAETMCISARLQRAMTEAAGTQQQHFRELAVARTTYCLPTSRLRLFFHLSF